MIVGALLAKTMLVQGLAVEAVLTTMLAGWYVEANQQHEAYAHVVAWDHESLAPLLASAEPSSAVRRAAVAEPSQGCAVSQAWKTVMALTKQHGQEKRR